MKLKLLLSIIFLSVINLLKASTSVPAVISTKQVWTISGSPYLISGNVIINQGISVDIKPGVEIISNGNYKLTVNGRLSAIGT